jgi:hypothetical protein
MLAPARKGEGTHRIIRTISADADKLKTIADLLGIRGREMSKLGPGKIHLVYEPAKGRATKSSTKKSSKR